MGRLCTTEFLHNERGELRSGHVMCRATWVSFALLAAVNQLFEAFRRLADISGGGSVAETVST